jgi:hypothetical protein
MLKTRVITGLILGALLLAILFLLSPLWTVMAWGLIFVIGGWEWAGFGGLRMFAARAAYTAAIAALLFAAWNWTEQRSNLLTLFGWRSPGGEWPFCGWPSRPRATNRG